MPVVRYRSRKGRCRNRPLSRNNKRTHGSNVSRNLLMQCIPRMKQTVVSKDSDCNKNQNPLIFYHDVIVRGWDRGIVLKVDTLYGKWEKRKMPVWKMRETEDAFMKSERYTQMFMKYILTLVICEMIFWWVSKWNSVITKARSWKKYMPAIYLQYIPAIFACICKWHFSENYLFLTFNQTCSSF